MSYNILAINPGSTSDDIGFYRSFEPVFEVKISYTPEDLAPYDHKNVTEMAPLKKKLILSELEKHNIKLEDIDVVMGRGGLTKPTEGGVFYVNDAMLHDLKTGVLGIHPCNLGGILAHEIASMAKCPALIASPEVVDELSPLARYSGFPELPRISIFHALSQRRVAFKTAELLGKTYKDCNFVVLHGGGGVTIGVHMGGRTVDVTNGLDGEGPMTPQRSGTLPSGGLVKLCYSGKYNFEQMYHKVKGRGGMMAHTGTQDCKELCDFIETGIKPEGSTISCSREKAKEFIDAMIYQFAKYIGYMAAVAEGKLDGVILTGALMKSKYISQTLEKKVSWLGKVFVYPDSDEKTALKEAAIRALDNPAIIKEYK